ncbi:unnamed protein product [Acidithrix sp. C25]|nr:unnamed protein product [Acidithrix sp. C25]
MVPKAFESIKGDSGPSSHIPELISQKSQRLTSGSKIGANDHKLSLV